MYKPFNTFVHAALNGIDPIDYTPQQRATAAEWVARQSIKDNRARIATFQNRWKYAHGRERLSLIASMAIMANGIRAISYPKTLEMHPSTGQHRSTGQRRSNPTKKGPKAKVGRVAGRAVAGATASQAAAPAAPPTIAEEHALITKVKQARVKLLFNFPFFGFIVSNLTDEIDDSLLTAATDGKKILWNSKFLESLSSDDTEFVLGHEAMHCVLQHLWRRKGRDPELSNRAADAAVNDMLIEGGLKEPKLDFQIIRGSNVVPGQNMTGKSMEEIYEELVKNKEAGGEPESGKGKGKGQSGNSGGTLDDHGEWQKADKKGGNEGSSDYWKAQAANSKQYGKVPGGVLRHLEEVLYPKADWRQLLSQGMYFPIDYSWAHMDRRLMAGGIYIPGLHGERHRAVFVIDTSGSMSGEQLSEFWAEIVYIARQQDIEIRVVTADAEIQNVWFASDFSPDLIKTVRGGGGTSFVPAFNLVSKWAEEGWVPEIVVYLTDLQGEFPRETPDQRVIWGVSKRDSDAKYPFGEMIVIE